MKYLLIICLIAFPVDAVCAQNKPNVLADIIGSTERIVLGAPFSGDAISESVQVEADGSKMSRRSVSRLYRDSAGRFRREETTRQLGLPGVVVEVPPFITITDPVSGLKYTLNIRAQTFDEFLYKPEVDLKKAGDKPKADETARRAELGSNANDTSDPNVKTESLGVRTIEGVRVEGTLTTIVVPADKIGNKVPVEVVSEKWYSPELQLIVFSKNSDPRLGVQTYRLTNIRRWEPPIEIFSPPPEYKLANDHRDSSKPAPAPAAPKKKPPDDDWPPLKPPPPATKKP